MALHGDLKEFNHRFTDVTGILRTVQRNTAWLGKNCDSQAQSCSKIAQAISLA